MTLYKDSQNSSNKKKIYQFQYETQTDVFDGYLDPECDYSIISLNRLMKHGFETDESKIVYKKITQLHYTRNNSFDNIKGIHEITILFENSSGGVVNGINGSLFKKEKVEKNIDVLVLKDSQVEFRLGSDFMRDNVVIERMNNSKKGNITHQLRFRDGVTVDLKCGKSFYTNKFFF
jgi:hypothetical protein